MMHPDVNQKCPYFLHSGPVGWLPAPNIFHLANEFDKRKMFWSAYYKQLKEVQGPWVSLKNYYFYKFIENLMTETKFNLIELTLFGM